MIKQFIVDSLNGFEFSQIPFFIFQLICAALLGHLTQFFWNKKFSEDKIEYGAVASSATAFLTSVVKYMLPVAIIAAAVILFISKRKESSSVSNLGTMLTLSFGLACGYGSIIISFIGFVFLMTIIAFLPLAKK